MQTTLRFRRYEATLLTTRRQPTYCGLQARPEGRERGDPGAREDAAVQVHLAQPALGRPAGLTGPQVAHCRHVQAAEHAQVLLVPKQQIRLCKCMALPQDSPAVCLA